jgi:hypothetical protein
MIGMPKTPLLITIIVLVVAIAVINAVAVQYSWYFYHWWLDMPMHFLGGLWVALATLWIVYHSGRISVSDEYRDADRALMIALIATGVVGILWEIFEFSVDTVLVVAPTYDVADTLSDLAFDMAGALIASTFFIGKEMYLEKK